MNYVVNHLVDKILGLLEKAYLPDHILEKFIEEALHYMHAMLHTHAS